MRYAARLVLLATTPRFVRTDEWAYAWSSDEFMRFGEDVARDSQAALERFVSLHVAAGSAPRRLLRRLRAEIFSRDVPTPQALRAGLDILRDTDLRVELADITVPTLLLQGERDQITFPPAAVYMAQRLPNAHYVSMGDAGHALPLSHQEKVAAMIGEFAGG